MAFFTEYVKQMKPEKCTEMVHVYMCKFMYKQIKRYVDYFTGKSCNAPDIYSSYKIYMAGGFSLVVRSKLLLAPYGLAL